MKKSAMPSLRVIVVLVIGLLLLVVGYTGAVKPAASASASKPKIETPVNLTWLGHSAFKLESEGKTVLVDPWIDNNPQCPIKLADLGAVDLILVTHDHFDHVGDTIAIAKATGATVVAVTETAAKLQADGLPKEQVVNGGFGQNIGGETKVNGIGIVMTQAVHSSNTGSPAGYIIKFPGGATIYDAGDTGIFSDMELLANLYPIHVALLPIGGVFTMDPYQASKSLKLLKPMIAIPMHYETFPMLEPNADNFVELAKKEAPEVDVKVLKPGESYTLK